MRVCLISSLLQSYSKYFGQNVVTLWPEHGGWLDLAQELETRNFTPDLIFQQESLGPRLILSGLEQFDCPKIFWSIDTHLNLFWQRHYCRLFDGVMTPHRSWLQNKPWLHDRPLAQLPFYGKALPWRPFSERKRNVGFVGRFSEHRPIRRWLAEFLEQEWSGETATDLSTQEMFAFYQDIRLAPNESISREVNFRLLEAASCGCLTLNPEVGPDQDGLLRPGKEMQIWAHVLELHELLAHYTQHPDQAEAMARRAWERVQAEHLPVHRVQAVLNFAATLDCKAARSHEAKEAQMLAVEALRRAGRFSITPVRVEQALLALPPTAAVTSALIRLRAENGLARQALDVCAAVVSKDQFSDDLEVNLFGSGAGVMLDNWDMARQFWYRWRKAAGSETPARPESPAHLFMLWEEELRRRGRVLDFGGRFDAGKHLPASACDCLYAVRRLEPQRPGLDGRFDSLFALLPGYEYMRLGHLSSVTLQQPDNWRAGATLAAVNLRACRLREGLEELWLARKKAWEHNKEKAFLRYLEGLDPSGVLRRRMQDAAWNK